MGNEHRTCLWPNCISGNFSTITEGERGVFSQRRKMPKRRCKDFVVTNVLDKDGTVFKAEMLYPFPWSRDGHMCIKTVLGLRSLRRTH